MRVRNSCGSESTSSSTTFTNCSRFIVHLLTCSLRVAVVSIVGIFIFLAVAFVFLFVFFLILALVEGRHRQHDPKGLSRGIVDVFCSCSMVSLAPIANASRMSREHWEAANVMQILKAGVLYVALVFGAGFVLGTVRTQLECILASVL